MTEFASMSFYTATDKAFDGRFTDPGYNPPQEENITTINAKVDLSLYTVISEMQLYTSKTITANDKAANDINIPRDVYKESAVPFRLWASAVPGQLAVQCINTIIMPHLVEERAAVVITNAHKLNGYVEDDFQFGGVVRTLFEPPADNGAIGPNGDEYFTLTLGGKVQLLNNSTEMLRAGDPVGWTFGPDSDATGVGGKRTRGMGDGPRQILLKKCLFTDPHKIGKVTSTIARKGAFVDILLQATTL